MTNKNLKDHERYQTHDRIPFSVTQLEEYFEKI